MSCADISTDELDLEGVRILNRPSLPFETEYPFVIAFQSADSDKNCVIFESQQKVVGHSSISIVGNSHHFSVNKPPPMPDLGSVEYRLRSKVKDVASAWSPPVVACAQQTQVILTFEDGWPT